MIALVSQFQSLYKRAYIAYKPEVERLINEQIKDENTIEHLLDGLLDFCSDSNMLLLYKQLCRYYWNINPQATAEYINFYREMWDNDNETYED